MKHAEGLLDEHLQKLSKSGAELFGLVYAPGNEAMTIPAQILKAR
ncbi:hypothetical protein [Rhizobium sp. 1399]|nr:hypothetical protein [Rhizobium sp. 1399]MDR6664277.1 hypothetical protein [Rhizobium sp. 1399]